jgi:hypothetical protein
MPRRKMLLARCSTVPPDRGGGWQPPLEKRQLLTFLRTANSNGVEL